MADLAYYCLWAAVALTAAALLGNLVLLTGRRTAAERKPHSNDASGAVVGDERVVAKVGSVAWVATLLIRLATIVMTASLVFRIIAVGHAPFSNQHEFACAFFWGILLAYVFFEWRYRIRMLAIGALPLAFIAGIYAAAGTDHSVDSLLPALQNHLLLTAHVITAVLGYGAAAVSCAAAFLYLIAPKVRWRGMPAQDLLDEIGYKGIVFAFPLLTIMLVLGALWADIAWGKYWSWDPKETAALVTWLIYGAYLHARVTHGWQGKRSAWLLMLGFVAIVFTFTGNYWFGGLHTYGGQ